MYKVARLLLEIETFYLLATADKVYGPFTKQDGRKIVIVVDEQGNRRTVSYPKHLVEQRLGRLLDKDQETIDHINYDINDNRPENLQILPRSEHSRQDTRRVKLIDLECQQCHQHFQRSPRLIRDKAKKGNGGPFCSRVCAGKYNRAVQLGLIEKLPPQQHIESEYYRAKNVAAMYWYLLEKYG